MPESLENRTKVSAMKGWVEKIDPHMWGSILKNARFFEIYVKKFSGQTNLFVRL